MQPAGLFGPSSTHLIARYLEKGQSTINRIILMEPLHHRYAEEKRVRSQFQVRDRKLPGYERRFNLCDCIRYSN